jgi:hypothetical protein
MTYVWILSCSHSMSGAVELETEVRDWLDGLSAVQFAAVAFCVDLLAERGPLLAEPYTPSLDGKPPEPVRTSVPYAIVDSGLTGPADRMVLLPGWLGWGPRAGRS